MTCKKKIQLYEKKFGCFDFGKILQRQVKLKICKMGIGLNVGDE